MQVVRTISWSHANRMALTRAPPATNGSRAFGGNWLMLKHRKSADCTGAAAGSTSHAVNIVEREFVVVTLLKHLKKGQKGSTV